MPMRPAAVIAALCMSAVAAPAAERLSADGARLAPATFAPGAAFERAVDAAGDEVLSVHAVLRPASSNLALARDRDGFWVEWDGDPASLPASAAVRDGPTLTFKLFLEPPRGFAAPFAVTLAYRTPLGLKFGWFEASPAAGAGE